MGVLTELCRSHSDSVLVVRRGAIIVTKINNFISFMYVRVIDARIVYDMILVDISSKLGGDKWIKL